MFTASVLSSSDCCVRSAAGSSTLSLSCEEEQNCTRGSSSFYP